MINPEVQEKLTPSIILDAGPGWRLLLKAWGRADFFLEVAQPDGSTIVYTIDAVANRVITWEAMSAL
jgi:hypothetical protein